MKNGILLLLLLCAVAMGYLLGRHSVVRPSTSTVGERIASSESSSAASAKAENQPTASTEKLSLAEIEKRIGALKVSDFKWGTGAPPAWLDLFAQIPTEDMPDVLDFISKNCPANIQRALRNCLFKHWADVDPRTALSFARNLANKPERESAVNLVITGWTANDSKAATEWARQLPAGTFRNEMLGDVITSMASNDPQAALDLFQSCSADFNRSGSPPYRIYQAIFSAWVAANPQEAIAKAAQLPSIFDRSSANSVIAITWAAQDPRAALAWARTLPSSDDRNMAMQNILSKWGNNDPVGTAEWVKQMPDGTTKQMAISQMERLLAMTDPKSALDLAHSLPTTAWAKENLVRDAVTQWASQDQDGALAYAQNLPAGNERTIALSSALGALALKDPKTAFSMVNLLPEGQAQMDLINSVAKGMAQSDPQAALTFAVENLKSQGQLNIFLNNMAGDWARKDLDTVKSWWQNVPEGPSRVSFIDGLVFTMLNSSTQDAADFVSGLPAAEQSRAVGSLMNRWANDDPEAAAKWAAGLTDQKSQAAAYQNLVMGWARSDPAKTSTWLSGLPDDQTRQSLAQTFVSYIGRESPPTAAPWVASIADENERNRAIQNVAQAWLAMDSGSAKEWLATTSLPDTLKQQLLKNY